LHLRLLEGESLVVTKPVRELGFASSQKNLLVTILKHLDIETIYILLCSTDLDAILLKKGAGQKFVAADFNDAFGSILANAGIFLLGRLQE